MFSLNGAYQASSHLTLSVGVDNVFDTTYTEHLNLAGNAAFGYLADLDRGINEPGRMVWARAASDSLRCSVEHLFTLTN